MRSIKPSRLLYTSRGRRWRVQYFIGVGLWRDKEHVPVARMPQVLPWLLPSRSTSSRRDWGEQEILFQGILSRQEHHLRKRQQVWGASKCNQQSGAWTLTRRSAKGRDSLLFFPTEVPKLSPVRNGPISRTNQTSELCFALCSATSSLRWQAIDMQRSSNYNFNDHDSDWLTNCS